MRLIVVRLFTRSVLEPIHDRHRRVSGRVRALRGAQVPLVRAGPSQICRFPRWRSGGLRHQRILRLGFSARSRLPASFEWPVDPADQLIEMPDGRRIAVHPASARIQVYDRDWKLLHAWVVHAGGGEFRAILLPDDRLVVWTVRGAQRYIFTLDGTKVEQTSYPPEQYQRLPVTSGAGYVPTPILLWPFSSSFAAWSVAVVGGLLLLYSDPKRFFKKS